MARLTRNLMIMAAAGTMLSGCSLIGSVADTTWSGTKTVAKWVSAPVRYVLRGTPDEDTQFAGVTEETDAALSTVETKTEETVTVAHMDKTAAEPFDTDVTTVAIAPVTSYASASYSSASYSTAQTSSSYSSTQTAMTETTQSYATAQISDDHAIWDSPSRYSIQTSARGDQLHFVRLKGETSMSDWMDCDRSSDGYWLPDANGGKINPAFEVCMRSNDYVLKKELGSYDTAEMSAVPLGPMEPVSERSVAGESDTPSLAGAGDAPKLRSSYVPTTEPQTNLPHKF